MVCEFVIPSATLPKLTLGGFAAICACAPVPVTETVIGEAGASLVIEMLPETFPAVVGANCTVNVAFEPPLRVAGNDIPLTVMPEPVGEMPETVTFEVPEFVRVTFFVVFDPTSTLPKLMLIGEAVRPGAVPVPVSDTETGEFDASLASVKVPVAPPDDCGANWI